VATAIINEPHFFRGSAYPPALSGPFSRFYGTFLGGWAAGQGLHELVSNGSWVNWNDCPSGVAGELPMGCFEGRRPDSLTHDANVYAFDFGVDWARPELRVITNGTVRPLPAPVVTAPHQPLVFFTTSRGGIRAAYDPINTRWSFKHLHNDLVDIDASPPLWRTTGMGDTCVNGAAWATHSSSSTPAVLMAVADGGVVRTLDGGKTFQQVSEEWWGGLQSDGTAIASDEVSGCVYAAHFDRGHGSQQSSVFQTCDGGDSWELIGGYGGASSNARGSPRLAAESILCLSANAQAPQATADCLSSVKPRVMTPQSSVNSPKTHLKTPQNSAVQNTIKSGS
jgi:hypothetical protein